MSTLREKPEWLDKSIILFGKTGSHAYGTATSESDTDYKGIAIPPKEYYLGLKTFDGYNNNVGKQERNTKDDVDVSVSSIKKFVNSAMQGSPNELELLYLKDYEIITALGRELVDNREMLLSKNVMDRYMGFARGQKKKVNQSFHQGKGRRELVEKHGYDTKSAMHSIRLLMTLSAILNGTFNQTELPLPQTEQLIRIRNGFYTFEGYDELFSLWMREAIEAYKATELPEKPDIEKINNLLIELTESKLFGGQQ